MKTPISVPLLQRVRDTLADFPAPWALCGGWAVDSWLGRQTRDHGDVDLSVFHDNQDAVFDYLGDGWLLNGHDDHDGSDTEPWTGRPLGYPAHVHAYRDDLNLDIQLNWRAGNDFVFSRRPHGRLPIDDCVRESPWGLPTLVPKAILFYKAWWRPRRGWIRDKDRNDFVHLAAILEPADRDWLLTVLTEMHPTGHPALRLLDATPARTGHQPLDSSDTTAIGSADTPR